MDKRHGPSSVSRPGHLAGTLTAMAAGDPTRHLPLDGTRNVRDIGGYPAAGGRRTRWRTLLRSDELTSIPRHAQAELVALGLRQVIDLRWPDEARPVAERLPAIRLGPLHGTSRCSPTTPRRTPASPACTATCSTPARRSWPRSRGPCSGRRAARDHRVCGRQGPHRGRHRPAPRPRRRADRGDRRGLRADRRLFLGAPVTRGSAGLAARAAGSRQRARAHGAGPRASRPCPRRRPRAPAARGIVGCRDRSARRPPDRARRSGAREGPPTE